MEPRSSRRCSGSGTCTPRTRRGTARRSSRSAHRTGSADEFRDDPARRRPHDHVAAITLNRPGALNSFNRTMCEEMAEAWRIVKLDVLGERSRAARGGRSGVLRRPGYQNALRATSQRVESRGSRGIPQPEVAEDVETRGVCRAGHVYRGGVLLRQRIRRGHLLRRCDVLRLPRQRRPGLRAGADRIDASSRLG